MLTLNHNFNDKVYLSDKEIPVDLSYNRVLKAYEILDSSDTPEPNKILKALNCFGVKGVYTLSERAFLLDSILNLVNDYSTSVDRYNYKEAGGGEKAIDYIRDTGLIYSAFLQAYGIDLFHERNKLHWVKFITLLNNMPDETRLSVYDILKTSQKQKKF